MISRIQRSRLLERYYEVIGSLAMVRSDRVSARVSPRRPFLIQIGNYTLYFCMDLQRPWKVADHAIVGPTDVFPHEASIHLGDGTPEPHLIDLEFSQTSTMQIKNAAVVFRLAPLAAEEEFLVRMGMSFISTDQACSNALEEIPTFDFERTVDSAVSRFEDILNRIRVNITGVSEDTLVLFYSSV